MRFVDAVEKKYFAKKIFVFNLIDCARIEQGIGLENRIGFFDAIPFLGILQNFRIKSF